MSKTLKVGREVKKKLREWKLYQASFMTTTL